MLSCNTFFDVIVSYLNNVADIISASCGETATKAFIVAGAILMASQIIYVVALAFATAMLFVVEILHFLTTPIKSERFDRFLAEHHMTREDTRKELDRMLFEFDRFMSAPKKN